MDQQVKPKIVEPQDCPLSMQVMMKGADMNSQKHGNLVPALLLEKNSGERTIVGLADVDVDTVHNVVQFFVAETSADAFCLVIECSVVTGYPDSPELEAAKLLQRNGQLANHPSAVDEALIVYGDRASAHLTVARGTIKKPQGISDWHIVKAPYAGPGALFGNVFVD